MGQEDRDLVERWHAGDATAFAADTADDLGHQESAACVRREILDMGLARVAQEEGEESTTITREGSIMGTPAGAQLARSRYPGGHLQPRLLALLTC